MNRRCIYVCGNVVVLSASVALAMSLAAPAQAGTCTNDAGGGDIAEGEACLLDNAANQTTDGCNVVPNTFHEIPDAELAGDGTVVVCGVASTYDFPGTTVCTVNGDCLLPNLPVCQGGFCMTNRRDTDWHHISAAALAAADVDANGVVQVHSLVNDSEFNSVTFFVALGSPVCNADPLVGPVVTVLAGVGCGGPQTFGNPVEAIETIELDQYPDGIVAFVAPGVCTGGGLFDGYECGTGNTDYNVTFSITDPFTACGDPDDFPLLGPCNTANPAVNGCEDPDCCKQVCLVSPFCCITGWVQNCANIATGIPCADQVGGPVCIATGPSSAVDGYLKVCTDPNGGWADPAFGGQGDVWNPFGNNVAGVPIPAQNAPSYSNAFFMYRAAQQQRELLSNNSAWKNAVQVEDGSLVMTIQCVVQGPNCIPGSVVSDIHGADGVNDHLVSVFKITGVGVDLTFDVTQDVQHLPGPQVSVLSQVYSIKNNTANSISFVLLRQVDYDLAMQGNFNNDSVGTGTNGSPLERHVSQGENPAAGPLNHTYITISSPQGAQYVGAKSGVDPDGAGPGLVFGAGTDVQEWDAYGVPLAWGNFIAQIGYNTNGYSATTPGTDAHVDLEVPVTIAGGATVVRTMNHTYGSKIPLGAGPPACPWSCGLPANTVVDVVDFLALLQQWAQVGTSCDFSNNGVDTVDFLKLLQHWGPCP